MKIVNLAKTVLAFYVVSFAGGALRADTLPFNSGWKFYLGECAGGEQPEFNDRSWASVVLPHTAHVEPLIVNDQWMGIAWYRNAFDVSESQAAGKVFIEFEGAMNYSQVWINGEKAADHHGGYLPVVIDATDYVKAGQNRIAVRLDNTDNLVTGPKPHFKTDFCKYGGLYRNAKICFKNKVYISHPQLAGKTAGGSIFISTPLVSEQQSTVRVQTHLLNELAESMKVALRQTLYFDDSLVGLKETPLLLSAKGEQLVSVELNVKGAKLWSPQEPNLYQLKTEVLMDGRVIDTQWDRVGIREFVFKENQLYINGKKTFLRGVNRHQEYPYVGYAISDQAQMRDARLIKEGGFDLIRLSHYPQSPAFMNACDELGIVVLDAILGWQYYSKEQAFNEYCFRSARNLVRRDRNHPCVLAWEVSLNETQMPVPFMQKLHEIVHAEYPGEQTYTCGWMPEVYDLFVQARQHRILHGKKYINKKPYLVSEYGDWEYYSRNAGLNQHKLDKTARVEKSSRQLREYGEARLKQQAFNVQESHNDNRANTPAFADAYWVMFDYNSGCHDAHCCCGVMDIFRLPKPAYWFYGSQRDPAEQVVLQVASYWNEKSPLDVKVFSNCDEVALFLNGKAVARQKPDVNDICSALEHPPFSFNLDAFEPGELIAVGYINGKKAAEHRVRTPGEPVALKMWLEDAGVPVGNNDTLFVRVAAVDENGTIVPDYFGDIDFSMPQGVTLLNVGEMEAAAGIASALVRVNDSVTPIQFSASTGNGIKSVQLVVHCNQNNKGE